MVEDCEDCEKEIQDFYNSFDNELPFEEIDIEGKRTIRKFCKDTAEHLLKWHFDDDDRVIRAFKKTDWKFQFDNELPKNLSVNAYISIQKGRIHRLIKGTTDLYIEIKHKT